MVQKTLLYTTYSLVFVVLLTGTPGQATDLKTGQGSTGGMTAASTETMLTIEGSIAKIVAQKKEIYVQGKEKQYEFYFTPSTTLSKEGQTVDFATLTAGLHVRVTALKVGQRLDPTHVEILP